MQDFKWLRKDNATFRIMFFFVNMHFITLSCVSVFLEKTIGRPFVAKINHQWLNMAILVGRAGERISTWDTDAMFKLGKLLDMKDCLVDKVLQST